MRASVRNKGKVGGGCSRLRCTVLAGLGVLLGVLLGVASIVLLRRYDVDGKGARCLNPTWTPTWPTRKGARGTSKPFIDTILQQQNVMKINSLHNTQLLHQC